ncbi:unnamed protein product [Arctia plantaginis]|uniref:Uncharacterized protein n=1 Tax=Arctia plantaginis TaxID=874455 RepID=A0A8S0ZJ24_ARCPL|nr:unnamed protein product [Arctia plantaginis]
MWLPLGSIPHKYDVFEPIVLPENEPVSFIDKSKGIPVTQEPLSAKPVSIPKIPVLPVEPVLSPNVPPPAA